MGPLCSSLDNEALLLSEFLCLCVFVATVVVLVCSCMTMNETLLKKKLLFSSLIAFVYRTLRQCSMECHICVCVSVLMSF